MEFRIAKTEFLRGLRLAQGIADRKSTMPMLANVAIHADEALAISIATPFGSCTTTSAFAETMVAGTNVSGRAGDALASPNRFLHRYNRSGTRPRLRENSAIVSPLCFHSSSTRRACSSFHRRLC